MPTLARFAAAVSVGALLTTAPAFAFSQIGTQDGAAQQREGIVSVPLPPLSGTSAPGAPPSQATEPQTAPPTNGAVPATAPPAATEPAATEPADQGAPPATGPHPSPETEPGAATPDDSTDAGETENPATEPGAPADEAPASDDGALPGGSSQTDDAPPPPVVYGDEGLPQPVRDLREKLLAIARAGDIEALRPYIQTGDEGTVLSFGEPEGDPIAFLKTASGDGEGVEILAILLEVLQAGHVRNEPDTDNEIFVWPYFTAVAIDKLTKPQKIELFELVTAGDYQEMLGFGAYNFYRVGISPDGKLQFFVAGD